MQIATLTLADHLARRGHHVEVWPLQAWGEEDDRAYEPLVERGAFHVIQPGPGGLAARLDELSRRDVDLVHLHSVFVPVNTRLARRLAVPYVVSPHSGYAPASLRRSAFRKLVYRSLVEQPYLRRASLRIALTDVEAAELLAFGAGEPVEVAPHGISPVTGPVDRTAFRQELGLADSERLVVFTGRLDVVHKGLDVLVRGVSEAPGWHLALIGSDTRGGVRQLRELARGHGMEDRLSFGGTRFGEPLAQAVAAADVFGLTSRWEGMPLSLLEALALGVPALVSPAVEARVPVAASGGGWVAEADEVGRCLRAVAAAGSPEWERRSKAARALADTYDWSEVAARYEQLYLDVLRRSASR